MEKEITNKLEIKFIIDVPKEIEDSDFNSLVLRMDKLRYSRKNTINEIDVEMHNHNIKQMQELLNNFIFRKISNKEV